MRVEVKQGDILAESGDVLICSANIYLNQSGGVGGEILRRHGDSMQRELHRYLVDHDLKFVQQGEVIETDGGTTGFQQVLHAVAVDGWYHSSTEVVANVLEKALRQADGMRAKKVVVAALATGYGRLRMHEFTRGLFKSINKTDLLQVDTIVVVVPREDQAQEIRTTLIELRVRESG